MDKSWMNIHNRLTHEFRAGVKQFIDFAKNHVNSEGKIKCPCKSCWHRYSYIPDQVHRHILNKGIDPTYKIWSHHGEKISPLPRVRPQNTQHEKPIANEMEDIMNDFVGESSENVDVGVDANLASLFSKLEEELYPGCRGTSTLHFIAQLIHIKVMYKWPNESVDVLLKLIRKILPDGGCKLPTTFYECKKQLKKLGLGYESIHACPYDCSLYWKENAQLQKCPVCNTDRWKKKGGKKVPHKVLRYFPLKDRLRRLYASRHTSKHMTWHKTGRSNDDDVMRHPVDGKEWKEFDTRFPDFAHEPRNVRLGLATDGFNPFGNMSLSYSMWPVVTIVYNLPPWLCNKDPYRQLTLLILGRKSPGKDIDVYLRPLIDELQELWVEGTYVHDAVSNTTFKMRAALLMTINDFPARSILSGWSGQGYKACPTCNDETPSMSITSKMCYVGHRRWLDMNNPLRKKIVFDGKIEKRPPPIPKTTKQILLQMQHLGNRIPGKHENHGGKKRKRSNTDLNWTKKSILWELPYWSSLTLRHNLDVMHIEKNVCDNLLGTLLCIEGKTKDTDKARIDLQNMGIREDLHLYKDGDRLMKPHAPYTLSPESCKKFGEWLINVKFPDGFASNLKKNVSVTNNNCKVVGLKSHDCHILIQRLLPTGVRKFLRKDIVDTITELCNFFKVICSRTLKVTDLEKATKDIVVILCKLEVIFPPAFFDVMLHLLLHLPEEAIRGGPVYLRWMYPIERFMGTLKKYVRNRAHPEGSIAEAYIANESLSFCSMYFENIDTKFNKAERNWVLNEDTETKKVSVFQNHFRSIGKTTVLTWENKTRKKAEYYILKNCPEIAEFFAEHQEEIVLHTSNVDIDTIQENEFRQWFHTKIYAKGDDKTPKHDQLLWLSSSFSNAIKSYSGCVVNGVKFLVQSRDMNLSTQNSGIYLQDSNNQQYYGLLDGIYELSYPGNNSVVLFACTWFNTTPNTRNVRDYKSRISINTNRVWYKNDPFILASQAEQVFYVDDPFNGDGWKVVEHFRHRHIWDSSVTVDDVDNQEEDVVNYEGIHLYVELPNLDNITYGATDIPPQIVTSDVGSHIVDDVISETDDIELEDEDQNEEAELLSDEETSDNNDVDLCDVDCNSDGSD